MKLLNYTLCLYTKILTIGYLVVCTTNLSSAQSLDGNILWKISNYQSIHHQEKIFVQTDRPVYVSGEEIWLSAFVVNAASQKLNHTERVLYIELISPDGTTCQKQVFKIDHGRAWGSIPIDQQLKAGIYRLVAFTNWMRNNGSDFYFSKQLTISDEREQAMQDTIPTHTPGNSIQNDRQENTATSPKIYVSFFPEGGDLIQGVSCRVAFEVVDDYGNSVNTSGLVVDESGQVVAAANTLWKGKGTFMLTPQPGHEYFVQIDEPDDQQQKFKIPGAKKSGLAMAVLDMVKQHQLKVIVQKSGNLPSDCTVLLVAMQNGIAKKAFTLDLSHKQTANIQMNKSDFTSGIVQLTLFDATQKPQAERLFFVKKPDPLSIKIDADSLANNPNGKVKLTMEVSDEQGNPVSGDFALSVTDALRVPDAFYHSPNILKYLSLYSDLPEYKSDDPTLFKNSVSGNVKSDLLMLTNGWRRYRWEEVLADSISLPQYFEEPGIYVKGTVRKSAKNEKIPDDAVVSMITKGKKMELFSEELGKDGAFTFLLNDFEDTMRAVVQTKNNMNIKKDYALNLTTNYQDKPVDHLSKLVTDNTHSIDLSPKKEESRKIEKGVLSKKEIRNVMDDLFVDTTDVTIGEVTVLGEKTKSQKEQITQKYGSPDYSVGKKRIEELVKEKPWHYGLMTILSNAFPNLHIETSQVTMTYKRYSGIGPPPQTSNITVSNSPNITFQLIGKRMHRFFIFVDGELISTSDTHGMVKSAAKGYSLNDLISLDPDLVTSIDLIFPNKNNSHSSLNGAAKIYEHEMRQSPSSAEANSGEASSSGNNSGNPLLQTNENADVMAKDLADLADESDKLVTPVAVLSIYTKDGAGMLSATQYKGIANLTLHGFTRVKEFYHPNYSKESNDSILSDLRNTLTWLPNLHTDSTGKASVSFYTSDVSNTFRVEVNGLSSQGKAGALLYKMSNPMFDLKADSIIAKENQAVANKQLAKATRILLPDSTGAAYALVSCPAKGWS
ncbi:MAG TPA: MG2 domain-containing protein, partial [Sunxiuqinia sp.]|nr:MG2 domain-containing protein [Sunxiuqinia sp.]